MEEHRFWEVWPNILYTEDWSAPVKRTGKGNPTEGPFFPPVRGGGGVGGGLKPTSTQACQLDNIYETIKKKL